MARSILAEQFASVVNNNVVDGYYRDTYLQEEVTKISENTSESFMWRIAINIHYVY